MSYIRNCPINIRKNCYYTFQQYQKKLNQMFRFNQVAICRGSVADNADRNNPNHIRRSIEGDLQVLVQASTGMVLLKLRDFEYGINPNDQVLYDDRDPRFKLMLCLDSNPENTWVLKINDKPELVYYILNQRCRLIHIRASRMILEDLRKTNKNIPQQYPELQDPQRLNYNNQKPQTTETGLIEASKTFANGLVMAGGFVSKVLQTIGKYLSKRVDYSPMNINPQTQMMVQKTAGTSKNFLDYSTQKFAGLFRVALNQAMKMEKRFEDNTEMGRKWKQDGTIDSAKNNLRVGVEAITNVYDGYSRGYQQATNGFSNASKQVVTAKYGPEAGQTAVHLAQGYKNVNKIPNIITDALKMVLKQASNQHIRKV